MHHCTGSPCLSCHWVWCFQRNEQQENQKSLLYKTSRNVGKIARQKISFHKIKENTQESKMKREVKTRVGGTRSPSSPGARDRARRLPVPKTQGPCGPSGEALTYRRQSQTRDLHVNVDPQKPTILGKGFAQDIRKNICVHMDSKREDV